MNTRREFLHTKLLRAVAMMAGILFATIASAQPGAEAWVRRYGEGIGSGGNAAAVVTDSGGSVIVTGHYSSSGDSPDYLTLKYSAGGVLLWTNRYNGLGNADDQAKAVAVDAMGNVFVSGSSPGVGSGYDFLTIAYSSAGFGLWTNRYNGPGNNNDDAYAMTVDGSGNVIVTGASIGNGSSSDYTTIKYSGAGVPLWTNRYNGPGNGGDVAEASVVNSGGDVFVTGTSTGVSSSTDYATIAYSSAGQGLWTNRYNGTGNFFDKANGIALDRKGNVIVAGYSTGNGGTGPDYLTIKYSGAGATLWVKSYHGYGNDSANSVAVDGSGNVFITGSSDGLGTRSDYVSIKYSEGGAALWTNRYNGPGNGEDKVSAVVADETGNFYVTGYSAGDVSGIDYATIAYSSSGLALWTNRYNGPANRDEATWSGRCLSVVSDGVIVAGGSDGDSSTGAFTDYAVVKYSTPASPNITAAEKLGNDLGLSFTSQVGYHYNIQARTNLVLGNWLNVLTDIPSGGDLTQTIVTDALLEPQQYFRIQVSP